MGSYRPGQTNLEGGLLKEWRIGPPANVRGNG
jgi:hypothetical protein